MADWIRTQGNQQHSLFAQLTDANGPLDIPPGTTVAFHGTHTQDPNNYSGPATVGGNAVAVRPGAALDDPNRGAVRYDLSTQDVSTPGLFYCQWTLTPPSSLISQSFPEDGRMVLIVLPAM